MLTLLRIVIGLIFLVSGVEKLLSPYQNFMYAIQAYQLLPSVGEMLVARLMPWAELIVGLFLVVGLWIPRTLQGAMVFFAIFITVVGQALLRGLPIDECGCLGQLVHIPPKIIIVIDSVMLLATIVLLRFPVKAKQLSLDKYFE